MKMGVKMIILDVDGTLTDGKIHISNSGEIFKSFNVKDGHGITKAINSGITIAIITGRKSQIVNKRANELGIQEVFQGVSDKQDILLKLSHKYNCSTNNIIYIGDDENDVDSMRLCGYSACPNDAVDEIKSIVDFVSKFDGGYGAVREIIDKFIFTI